MALDDNSMVALRGGKPDRRNIFDCMVLLLDPTSDRLIRDRSCLPLRVHGRPLQVGERVMAVGFPELSTVRNQSANKAFILTERMYGAVGEIIELFPRGQSASRPWPAFRVKGNWRHGMSGGPVFNEQGEVVGLVSVGGDYEDDQNEGYAFWFEPIDLRTLVADD